MLFDYKFYIEYYEDLKKLSFLDACNHFLTKGLEEKKKFNNKLINFDYDFYTNYYEDLKELSFLDACNHFLLHGIKEERYINKNIDTYKLLELCDTLENKYNNNIINNLKFLHITKTGGTSVEEFAIKLGIKFGKYDELFFNKYNKEGFWHIPLSYFDSETIDKYKWFTIVRNPYNRIISEINFLIKSNHIKIDNFDFNRYLQYILSNLLTDENKLNIEFIESNEKMYAFHFIPQYFYTCYNDYETIISNLKIIKFENLNEEFNNFLKELEIEEEFDTHENKNEQKSFEFEDLSIKNIKLINQVYKKDFILFNYIIKN